MGPPAGRPLPRDGGGPRGGCFFVRFLVVRNGDYRRRIEQQKNLVTLGTAASTLAHEIKNPLLSIRLQASILARTLPEEAQREIGIIESEVERLSQLSNRVNDFLRDPAGIPGAPTSARSPRRSSAVRAEQDLPGTGVGPWVRIDPERLRSVLENLLRNALESGGKDEEVAIEIARADGRLGSTSWTAGQGLPPGEGEGLRSVLHDQEQGNRASVLPSAAFVSAADGTISRGRPRGRRAEGPRLLPPEAAA